MANLLENWINHHPRLARTCSVTFTAAALAFAGARCSPLTKSTETSISPISSSTPIPFDYAEFEATVVAMATKDPEYAPTAQAMISSIHTQQAYEVSSDATFAANMATITSLSEDVEDLNATATAVVRTATPFIATLDAALAETRTFLETPGNLQSELDKLPPRVRDNAISIFFESSVLGFYDDAAAGSGAVISTAPVPNHPELQIIHIVTNQHVAEVFTTANFNGFSISQPHKDGQSEIVLDPAHTFIATPTDGRDLAIVSTVISANHYFPGLVYETLTDAPVANTFAGLGFRVEASDPFGLTGFNTIILPIRFENPQTQYLPETSEVEIQSSPTLAFQGQSGTVLTRQQPDGSWTAWGLITTISPECANRPDCSHAATATLFPENTAYLIQIADESVLASFK